MDVYNVAGSRIYIGQKITPKANMTAADFAGQTFTEIDGWTTAGAMGDTAEVTSTTLINSGRVIKTKGARDAGDSEHTFVVDDTDAGQIALLAAEKSCDNYAFRIEWAKGCETTSTVTISIASPGVVTWPNHGLTAGAAVKFDTSGTLPTGLVAGTTYYVVTAGLTAGAFSVAAAPGGTAIATTGAQTGTQTATAIPAGRTRLMAGLVTSYSEAGGGANDAQTITSTVAINSNIVRV